MAGLGKENCTVHMFAARRSSSEERPCPRLSFGTQSGAGSEARSLELLIPAMGVKPSGQRFLALGEGNGAVEERAGWLGSTSIGHRCWRGAAWRGEQLRARIGRPKPTGVPGDRAMARGLSDGIKKVIPNSQKRTLRGLMLQFASCIFYIKNFLCDSCAALDM